MNLHKPFLSILVLCSVSLLLNSAAAAAQVASSGDPKTDYRLERMLESAFLTVSCQVPSIQPKVTTLRRSWIPATDQLIEQFFGNRDNLLAEEQVVSPMWGKGRRYKSGMILHLAPLDQSTRQISLNQMSGVEVVPTFLDVYSTGFVYANNVPHKAVYATDVKVLEETKADVSYYNVFTEVEGQQAAEALISEMFGQLAVPAGFQSSTRTLIQHFGERLFAYRVVPEYITEYNVYESSFEILAPDQAPAQPAPERKVLATHQVAIPVSDVYVHLVLDGDKMLCGMEYFWDNAISATGTPQECIHAGIAVSNAREQLFEIFDGQPPLVTITNIMLAFIQDRENPSQLIPAWLFDAWYQDRMQSKEPNPRTNTSETPIQVPLPFAINALDGDCIML